MNLEDEITTLDDVNEIQEFIADLLLDDDDNPNLPKRTIKDLNNLINQSMKPFTSHKNKLHKKRNRGQLKKNRH